MLMTTLVEEALAGVSDVSSARGTAVTPTAMGG